MLNDYAILNYNLPTGTPENFRHRRSAFIYILLFQGPVWFLGDRNSVDDGAIGTTPDPSLRTRIRFNGEEKKADLIMRAFSRSFNKS